MDINQFDAKKISEALSQTCSDKMEPPVRADIRIEEFDGALLVVAHVPETEPFQKPCYIKHAGPTRVPSSEPGRVTGSFPATKLTVSSRNASNLAMMPK